jgi:hypothetical protein
MAPQLAWLLFQTAQFLSLAIKTVTVMVMATLALPKLLLTLAALGMFQILQTVMILTRA